MDGKIFYGNNNQKRAEVVVLASEKYTLSKKLL
jgi:hypothetical protein